jgi:hypothetical protein
VQITAQHSEAVGKSSGVGVKERLLLDGVALHATNVSPGNIQGAATIETNLADAWLALRDGARVSAGVAAHATVFELLVQIACADVLIDDFAKCTHGLLDLILLRGESGERAKAETEL